jgi:hypothetical protein
VLKKILEEYESEHAAAPQNEQTSKESDNTVLPRLFSIGPLPSMKWRFIDINAPLLASMVAAGGARDMRQYAALFHRVVNFEAFRCYG